MLLNYLYADSDNTVLCPKANFDHLAELGEMKRYDCNIVAVQDVEEVCNIIFNE